MPDYTYAARRHEETDDTIEVEASFTRPPSAVSHSKLVPPAPLLRDVPSMPALPTSITGFYDLLNKIKSPPPAASPPSDPIIKRDVIETVIPHLEDMETEGTVSSRLDTPALSYSSDAMDELAPKFFSVDHMNIILRDQRSAPRFRSFLHRFRSDLLPILTEYVNIQKALSALEYAYSLVESVVALKADRPALIVSLDSGVEAKSFELAQDMADEVLPQYLTYQLTELVTDTLVKEVTGQGMPLMRDLLPALGEVYCLSDPSLPDNPIVYASEGEPHATRTEFS